MTSSNDKFVATAIDMNRSYLNIERLNCDDFDKCNRFPDGVVVNSIIEALERVKMLEARRTNRTILESFKANLMVAGHNLDFRTPFI